MCAFNFFILLLITQRSSDEIISTVKYDFQLYDSVGNWLKHVKK